MKQTATYPYITLTALAFSACAGEADKAEKSPPAETEASAEAAAPEGESTLDFAKRSIELMRDPDPDVDIPETWLTENFEDPMSNRLDGGTNDPDIPDHPIGGEDFLPNFRSLTFRYLFLDDPTFCDGLESVDIDHVREAMEAEGADTGGLKPRIRQMVCMDYFRLDDDARLAAHRMLTRLRTSQELGMPLDSEKSMEHAALYAIQILALSQGDANGPDRFRAWQASVERGWGHFWNDGTDLGRRTSPPGGDWYGELSEAGIDSDDLHMRYNYHYWEYFGDELSDEVIARTEAERIAKGIPPQGISNPEGDGTEERK